MAQIKPYHFRLTKVSKKHVELVDALLNFLPASGARENFHVAIRKALHKYLSDVGYYLAGIEEIGFKDFFSRLPNPCSVAVLSLEPFQHKGFVEIDPFLSHMMIEKLLGGKGDDFGELKPMTETEQGVIEFLLLKILSQIHQLCGEQAKLHFRLERTLLEPAHIRSFARDDDPLICLKIHVSCLKRSGFVKIFLPHPWILEGFMKNLPGDKKSYEHKEIQNHLNNFEDQPCELLGTLGEASVVHRDLKSLEEGDVVLLDKSGLSHKKGAWEGDVNLVAGNGESGGYKAEWDGFSAGGHIRLVGTLKGGVR